MKMKIDIEIDLELTIVIIQYFKNENRYGWRNEEYK